MKKILFVCLGNICRSPLAHYVMLDKINKKNLQDKFYVDSCGMGSWHQGELSDSRMRATAKKHGIILKHLARQFTLKDPDYFDHVYAMDLENYHAILKYTNNNENKNKVKLFRYYEDKDNSLEVPDPYYGGDSGFEKVYQIVDKNCDLILENLQKE